jgi:hypothetical protein
MDVALVNNAKFKKAEGKLVGLPEEKQEYFKNNASTIERNIYQA